MKQEAEELGAALRNDFGEEVTVKFVDVSEFARRERPQHLNPSSSYWGKRRSQARVRVSAMTGEM